MSENSWLDCYGNRYGNEEIFKKILSVATDGEHEYKIIVGTDSNANGRLYKFVTALCIWNVGHGADYYYLAHFEPKSTYRGGNHKMRLFNEAVRSVEVADAIKEGIGITVESIHADVSEEMANEYSSDVAKQVRGYITGCGYNAVLKPASFVASCTADRHSK